MIEAAIETSRQVRLPSRKRGKCLEEEHAVWGVQQPLTKNVYSRMIHMLLSMRVLLLLLTLPISVCCASKDDNFVNAIHTESS